MRLRLWKEKSEVWGGGFWSMGVEKSGMSYIENLKNLNFQIENHNNSSVYLVCELEEYIKKNESPYIIIALDKAEIYGINIKFFGVRHWHKYIFMTIF